jgi:predicted N-acetyltransferase YhbS
MKLRWEKPEDYEPIAQLLQVAFQGQPYSSGSEHIVVEKLRSCGQLSLSLLADLEGELLGHVALSPVRLSCGEGGWYGLGPVAVWPDWQAKGVGSLLVRGALEELQKWGAAGCVVLGNPAYYGRFGFLARPELTLPGVPAEYFQCLSFSGRIPRSEVRYHQAFGG